MKKVKDITLRKADIEDVKDILSFSYHMYLETMDGEEGDFDAPTVADMATRLIQGKDSDILIVENGKPVGMSAVWVTPSHYNRGIMLTDSHHLYIDPDYRHSSAIKVLCSGIKNWARNKKAPWILSRISEGKRFNIKRMF